jgi:uncharacterized protein (DUF362 family)
MERRKLLKGLTGVGLSSLVASAVPLVNGSKGPRIGSGVDGILGPTAEASGLRGAAEASSPGGAGAQNAAADTTVSEAVDEAFPHLAVARARAPEELVKAALGALGGVSRFISKGDKVIIKPNMGWDRTPEQAANTNPEVVRTLVDLCFGSGAKEVIVADNSCNEARRCYVRSGVAKAAEEAGATVRYMDERKFKDMKIGGDVIKEWPVYTDFVEVDKIINVPIAKHHSLTRLTLSMKNWLGAVGGSRNRLHQKIDESCVDLAAFFKPTVTVLDAVRILKGNGPQGGNLKDVEKIDTLAASVDQTTIDSFGATLFGLKGDDLGCVRVAARMGFGQADLSKIKIAEV